MVIGGRSPTFIEGATSRVPKFDGDEVFPFLLRSHITVRHGLRKGTCSRTDQDGLQYLHCLQLFPACRAGLCAGSCLGTMWWDRMVSPPANILLLAIMSNRSVMQDRQHDLRFGLCMHGAQRLYVPFMTPRAPDVPSLTDPVADYSQCIPGAASSTTVATAPGSTTTPPTSTVPTTVPQGPSTTTTGATPTGSQIRAVEAPVYHFHLQNKGTSPMIPQCLLLLSPAVCCYTAHGIPERWPGAAG